MDIPELIIKPDRNKYLADILIYFIIAQLSFNFMLMTNIFIESKKFYNISFIITALLLIYIFFTVLYAFCIYKFIVTLKSTNTIELYHDQIKINYFNSTYRDIHLKIQRGLGGKILVFKTSNGDFVYDYALKNSDLDAILKKIKIYELGFLC